MRVRLLISQMIDCDGELCGPCKHALQFEDFGGVHWCLIYRETIAKAGEPVMRIPKCRKGQEMAERIFDVCGVEPLEGEE